MERKDMFLLQQGCMFFGFGFAIAGYERIAIITAIITTTLFFSENDYKHVYRLRYILAILLSGMVMVLYHVLPSTILIGFTVMACANIVGTVKWMREDLYDYRTSMNLYICTCIVFLAYTFVASYVPFGKMITCVMLLSVFLPMIIVYGLQYFLLHSTKYVSSQPKKDILSL